MKKLSRVALFVGTIILLLVLWDELNKEKVASETGQLQSEVDFPAVLSFYEGFESIEKAVLPVFNSNAAFNNIALQSPATPSVDSYVEHRKCILLGTCDFLDNRLEISSEQAYGGKKSLRFYAVPPEGSTVSKSLVENTLLSVGDGDDIWYSAWHYIDQGWPTTLADFEASKARGGPGPRITLFSPEDGLAIELKHGFRKPKYRQDRKNRKSFPKDKWVHVAMHLKMSADDDGIIELWQDCEKVIDTTGRNLPQDNTVLDRIQVGITATESETALFVDDISFEMIETERFMPHCKDT